MTVASKTPARCTDSEINLNADGAECGQPLNVLILLGETDDCASRILDAVRRHYALICTAPLQFMRSALGCFVPDVVIIDSRMPAADAVVELLRKQYATKDLTFIVIGAKGERRFAQFLYRLELPVSRDALQAYINDAMTESVSDHNEQGNLGPSRAAG